MLKPDENGEQRYELSGAFGSRVVCFNSVGTITQIHNSGSWFKNVCFAKAVSCPWTAFLCYDTDAYDADVTKFHRGDWKLFRESLLKLGDIKIVDLTAKADIEDIMLLDLRGISVYMKRDTDLTPEDIPPGRKGSARMKRLFIQQRERGKTNSFYHKGSRARALIDCLDLDLITEKSGIPFLEIDWECFLP